MAQSQFKFYTALLIVFIVSCTASRTEVLIKEDKNEKLIVLGAEQYTRGQYDSALVSFTSVEKSHKFNYEILNYLGVCFFKKKDFEKAKKYFEESIKLNNYFADSHNNLGYMWLKQERYELALSEFEIAIKNDPTHEKAIKNRNLTDMLLNKKISLTTIAMFGQAFDSKNLDQQIEQYKNIIYENPELKEASNNLAVCYFYKGDLKSSRAFLEDILKDYPYYYEAHNNLAYILHKQKEDDVAIRHYLTSIKIKPSYLIALINLGDLYFDQNKKLEAEKVWRTVLKVDPVNTDVIERLNKL